MLKRTILLSLGLVAACGGTDDMEWKHQTKRPFAFGGDSQLYGPIITGDLALYCGGYGWSREGEIGAVNVSDGTRRWAHNVGWCFKAPLVVDDVAIGYGSTGDSMIIAAVSLPAGELLWRARLPQHFQFATPLAHQGSVYIVAPDSLLRIDARSGSLTQIPLEGCESSWIASDAQRLLIGCNGAITSFDPAMSTRTPLVQLSATSAGGVITATLDGNALYLVRGKGVARYDLATGAEVWNRAWRRVPEAVSLSAGVLYVQAWPNLVAVDPLTGRDRWSTPVRSFNKPLHAGNSVYTTDHHGIVELDATAGQLVRRWDASAEVSYTPALAGGFVLFGDLKGRLVAVRK